MQQPHISQIHIENFKCFKKLDIPEFRQINLIGGKNNVGKTALLETIELLSQSSKPVSLLYYIQNMLKRRQSISQNREVIELDFMYNESSYLVIKSDSKICEVRIEESKLGEDTFILRINGEETKAPEASLLSWDRLFYRKKEKSVSIHYIKSSKTSEQQISLLYGTLVDINKEGFLNSSLAIFDENLVAIKQRAVEGGVILKIQKKDREHPVLLSSLGDGVNRYIAILCAIWASQDGILLIDEIENGIHYTNYPKLWDLIFKLAKEANCQLFITSHSKECIEAFNRVQLDNNDEHSLYLELFKSKKDGLIKSFSREPEQLGYALTHEGNIRGE